MQVKIGFISALIVSLQNLNFAKLRECRGLASSLDNKPCCSGLSGDLKAFDSVDYSLVL